MYFDQAGPANTRQTVELALEAARARNISHVVVASVTGETARLAVELNTSGLKLVCVSHHVGFEHPGEDELPQDSRRWLTERGVPVLTTTHVLAGVDRALRFKFGGLYPPEIIAGALRMFGQGVKVAIEVSVMALDAGLIPYGVPVVSVAGSSRGADAAIVVVPQHSTALFDLKVQEIICKPRAW